MKSTLSTTRAHGGNAANQTVIERRPLHDMHHADFSILNDGFMCAIGARPAKIFTVNIAGAGRRLFLKIRGPERPPPRLL
jgi:hypothetical protein